MRPEAKGPGALAGATGAGNVEPPKTDEFDQYPNLSAIGRLFVVERDGVVRRPTRAERLAARIGRRR